MKDQLISRNVTIEGRRTSIRLEQEIWDAFDEICLREGLTPQALCTLVEHRRRGTNRTSAVRAFIVTYFRLAANGAAKNRPREAEKTRRQAETFRGDWREFPYPTAVLQAVGAGGDL